MAEMALFKIPREEWIQIANTTLTEDVASLEFTTDINGNPFNCKKIVLRVMLSGGHGVAGQEWWFGRNAECKSLTINTFGAVYIMEVNGFFARYYGESYAGWLQDNMYRACMKLDDVNTIEKFVLQAPTANLLKSGDKIEVWGLKA